MRTPTILLLLLFSPLAFGQIYSWRDAEGKVHYSDVPPTDSVNVRKITPSGAVSGDTGNARRDLAQKEMEFKKRQLDAAEAGAKVEKEKIDAEDRDKNCTQAKSYLRALESGERISRSNEKGERAFLDDQSRSQEIVSTRRAIESWCK